MAANLRTIHIGAGQSLVAGVSYPTYQAFWDDIGVGLPGDISAGTGVDEDWTILFYGDGVSSYIDTTYTHYYEQKLTADGQLLTFAPAVGHRWFDNIDPATEAVRYYGPSKGVTVRINDYDIFAGTNANYGASGLLFKIEPGFQFLANGVASYVTRAANGSHIEISGAIVWAPDVTGNPDPIIMVADNVGDIACENNLIFAYNNRQAIRGRYLTGASRVTGNTVIHTGPAPTDFGFEFYSAGAGVQVKNNIVIGWPDVFDDTGSAEVASFVTDGTAAGNADIDGTTATVLGVDPATVFEAYVAGSVTPGDYDVRLAAGSPAIGVGQFVTGQPTVDLFGADRSATGFDAGLVEFAGVTVVNWTGAGQAGSIQATGRNGAVNVSSNRQIYAQGGSVIVTGRSGAVNKGVGKTIQAARGTVAATGRAGEAVIGISRTVSGVKGTVIVEGRAATIQTSAGIVIAGQKGTATVSGRGGIVNVGSSINLVVAAGKGSVTVTSRSGVVSTGKSAQILAKRGSATAIGRAATIQNSTNTTVSAKNGRVLATGRSGVVSLTDRIVANDHRIFKPFARTNVRVSASAERMKTIRTDERKIRATA